MGVIGEALQMLLPSAIKRLSYPVARIINVHDAMDDGQKFKKIISKSINDVERAFGRKGELTESLGNFLNGIRDCGFLQHLVEIAILYPPIDEYNNKTGKMDTQFSYENREGARECFCSLYIYHTGRTKSAGLDTYDRFMRSFSRSLYERRQEVEIKQVRELAKNSAVSSSLIEYELKRELKMRDRDLINQFASRDKCLVNLYGDEGRKKANLPPFPPKVSIDALREWGLRVSEAVEHQTAMTPVYGADNQQKHVNSNRVFAECPVKLLANKDLDAVLNPNEVYSEIHHAVLLGDPGGGKTTLTRWCSTNLAQNAQHKLGQIPILSEAKRYRAATAVNPNISIVDFLAAELSKLTDDSINDTKSYLLNYLGYGHLFLIFDGIDEIIELQIRREYRDAIQGLAHKFPLCRILVTSRKHGYSQAPMNGFDTYELMQLPAQNAKELFVNLSVELWGKKHADAEKSSVEFMKGVGGYSADLIGNPLMLTLMCWLFHMRQGELPATRAGLYSACAKLMFDDWDRQRGIQSELPQGFSIFDLIREIAVPMFTEAEYADGISKRRLTQMIEAHFVRSYYKDVGNLRAKTDAESVVRFVTGRAWILTEKGPEYFNFTHRTFLEYFFAQSLHEKNERTIDLLKAIEPKILDGSWHVPSVLAIQERIESTRSSASIIANYLIEVAQREKIRKSNLQEYSSFMLEVLDCLSGVSEMEIHSFVRTVIRIDQGTSSISRLLWSMNKRRRAIVAGISDEAVIYLTEVNRKTGQFADELTYGISKSDHRDLFESLLDKLQSDEKAIKKASEDKDIAKIHLDIFGDFPDEAARRGAEIWNSSVIRIQRKTFFVADVVSISEALLAVFAEGASPKGFPILRYGLRILDYERQNRIQRLTLHFQRSPIFTTPKYIYQNIPINLMVQEMTDEYLSLWIFSHLAILAFLRVNYNSQIGSLIEASGEAMNATKAGLLAINYDDEKILRIFEDVQKMVPFIKKTGAFKE